jgi:alkylation response protein AidB-like acyl-CoA dehydrogenase
MDDGQDFELYKEEALRYLWEVIEPRAEEWDRTGEIPREELWPELKDIGFLAARVPSKYGGLGLTHKEYIQLEKEWAKISGGLRVILHVHNLGTDIIRNAGTKDQKRKYLQQIANNGLSIAFALTEPHAGSGRDIDTAIQETASGYVLDGQKHHITNAHFAEYINVVAKSPNGISNVLVPRDSKGLKIRKMPETMGSHGSEHCYLEFNDYNITEENILGQEGKGWDIAIDTLRVSRIYIAANALGIAERCLEVAIDWAKQRVTFNKPIAERQMIQSYLAEMARDVYTLKLAVDDAVQKADNKTTIGLEADLTKLLAIDVNRRVTDRALLILGGLGYYRNS